jgi:adenosylcobinamide-GDP ribazoletransferase
LGFFTALKFLTVLPLFNNREDRSEDINGSIVYYPVVGLFIGIILVILNWLFSQMLPQSVTNGLLIVSLVIITGALHLDGFTDTCDGLGGHKPVEARWQAMHDSRTGAFGVVGAILLLLMEYVSLNSLPARLIPAALILMPIISRWAMVFAIFAYPYARPEGLGKILKEAATARRFMIATLITLILTAGAGFMPGSNYFFPAGLSLMLATWIIIVIVAGYFRKMFAGLTGDNYGAINEIAEVSVLLLMNILSYQHWFF